MKAVKQILIYLRWTVVAVLTAFYYVRLLAGPVPDEETFGGFWFVAQLFYGYGVFYVGLAIGSIVVILFMPIDIFYLKKDYKTSLKEQVSVYW